MGVLRLLLAIGVVGDHTDFYVLIGGYSAVQVFFVLSGFYMALIATRYPVARDFYVSRLLRIMPAFWVCAALAVLYNAIAVYGFHQHVRPFDFLDTWDEQPLVRQIWWVVANTMLVGADLGYFLPGDGFATPYLLMPPSWSLAVELVFYALCPLLMRQRTWVIALLTLTIFATRAAAYAAGLDAPPWHSRFVGFEIGFFCLGILAYRAYAMFEPALRSRAIIGYVSAGVAALVVFPFQSVVEAFPWPPLYGFRDFISTLLACATIAACLPGLFALSRNSKADNAIGEYSYPVYLIHYPLVIALNHTGVLPNGSWFGFAVITVLSMAHAALIYRLVQVPVDRLRHRLTLRRSAGSAPENAPATRPAVT